MKTTWTWDCAWVLVSRPSAILDRCSDLEWNRWNVTLLTSPVSKDSVFTCPHKKRGVCKTIRFQKSPLLKTVFESLRFHQRCSVDDRRKRVKKYASSNENALVWIGPQN